MNIMNKNNILEFIKSNKTECIVFFLYVFLLIVLSLYHEPWFDELQAWGVSKDSLYNIFFHAPHYEGHPPLWCLILKCFSYFNVPVEVGIKVSNIIFISSAMFLLIFKSPFSKKFRMLLPFTYFLFYQYGIINRPYSIFCFAVFLCAFLYKSRNLHPFKFILSLCLLCLSSAYGIAVAFGIVLAWIIQIIKEKGIKNLWADLYKDSRTKAVLLLYSLMFLLTIEIFPAKNTYEVNQILTTDYLVKFIYSFFSLISDTIITDVINPIKDSIYKYNFTDLLHVYNIKAFDEIIIEFWLSVFIGLIVTVFLFRIFKKLNNLTLYSLSIYSFLFVVFALYVLKHHIGIYIILLIFAFWAAVDENKTMVKVSKFTNIIVNILLFIQILWSFTASMNDVLYNYSFGRELSNYLSQYKSQNYRIMSSFFTKEYLYDKATKKNFFSPENKEIIKVTIVKPNMQVIPVSVNQYLNYNIFYTSFLLFSDNPLLLNLHSSLVQILLLFLLSI